MGIADVVEQQPDGLGSPKWYTRSAVQVAGAVLLVLLLIGAYLFGQSGPAEQVKKLTVDKNALVAQLINYATVQACAARTTEEAGNVRSHLKDVLKAVGAGFPSLEQQQMDKCIAKAGTTIEGPVKKSATGKKRGRKARKP